MPTTSSAWERSSTYHALRVARALDDLPLTRDRFIGGLAYSRVLQITRIATRETEAEWIEFAEKTTLKRLRLEVSDAKGNGRKKPRKDQYSLPAQRMRLPFDFSPDEYTILMTALRKKSAELSQALGEEITPKEALQQLAIEILETDPRSVAEGRVEREGAAFSILYRHCPECRRSDVETDDGPMEIAPEVIERHEKTAEKFVIRPEEEALPKAAPTTEVRRDPDREAHDRSSEHAALPREALSPGGRRCSNRYSSGARFGRRVMARIDRSRLVAAPTGARSRSPLELQGNHLKRRSEGGETTLNNENSLCIPCHALHTAGLLDISGNPLEGLTFTPRGVKLARALAGEKASVEAMPVVIRQIAMAPAVTAGNAEASHAGKTSLTTEEASALEDATLGLVALGYRKADAAPSGAASSRESDAARGEDHLGDAPQGGAALRLLAGVPLTDLPLSAPGSSRPA